jgi:hypothetical protein
LGRRRRYNRLQGLDVREREREREIRDAYFRMEIAFRDGWKAVAEIEESIATKDELRRRWREAADTFLSEAASFVDLLQDSASSQNTDPASQKTNRTSS